jgi:hypothetical protein
MLIGFAILAAGVTPAVAQKVPIKPLKQFTGSITDDNVSSKHPGAITNAKDLEKLWKDWKIEGKVPAVDFTTQFVVITTGKGSKLNLIATLDEKGNLDVLGMGTLDFVPGFRYAIATVSREGIKSVNGKPLPK